MDREAKGVRNRARGSACRRSQSQLGIGSPGEEGCGGVGGTKEVSVASAPIRLKMMMAAIEDDKCQSMERRDPSIHPIPLTKSCPGPHKNDDDPCMTLFCASYRGR